MSREMKEGSTEAYRVILERKYGDKVFDNVTFGPFATLAAARGILTRETSAWTRYNYSDTPKRAIGRIQRTSSTWEDIE